MDGSGLGSITSGTLAISFGTTYASIVGRRVPLLEGGPAHQPGFPLPADRRTRLLALDLSDSGAILQAVRRRVRRPKLAVRLPWREPQKPLRSHARRVPRSACLALDPSVRVVLDADVLVAAFVARGACSLDPGDAAKGDAAKGDAAKGDAAKDAVAAERGAAWNRQRRPSTMPTCEHPPPRRPTARRGTKKTLPPLATGTHAASRLAGGGCGSP